MTVDHIVPDGGDDLVNLQLAHLLCNEKSFSNAEILAHAFRTLKRGTLVGQRTYGGVISTGGTTLLDGTSVRIPFRGWYLPDGSDMENNGAVPDPSTGLPVDLGITGPRPSKTAALISALDLVITVCSTVVHLAGALGRPTWVLAPHAPAWRYLLAGREMPWYPSVVLYRQSSHGDWNGVLSTVASDLQCLAA